MYHEELSDKQSLYGTGLNRRLVLTSKTFQALNSEGQHLFHAKTVYSLPTHRPAVFTKPSSFFGPPIPARRCILEHAPESQVSRQFTDTFKRD